MDFKGYVLKREGMDEGLGVSHIPERKKVALYVDGPGYGIHLGYFTSEENAQTFIDLLSKIVDIKQP